MPNDWELTAMRKGVGPLLVVLDVYVGAVLDERFCCLGVVVDGAKVQRRSPVGKPRRWRRPKRQESPDLLDIARLGRTEQGRDLVDNICWEQRHSHAVERLILGRRQADCRQALRLILKHFPQRKFAVCLIREHSLVG